MHVNVCMRMNVGGTWKTAHWCWLESVKSAFLGVHCKQQGLFSSRFLSCCLSLYDGVLCALHKYTTTYKKICSPVYSSSGEISIRSKSWKNGFNISSKNWNHCQRGRRVTFPSQLLLAQHHDHGMAQGKTAKVHFDACMDGCGWWLAYGNFLYSI